MILHLEECPRVTGLNNLLRRWVTRICSARALVQRRGTMRIVVRRLRLSLRENIRHRVNWCFQI